MLAVRCLRLLCFMLSTRSMWLNGGLLVHLPTAVISQQERGEHGNRRDVLESMVVFHEHPLTMQDLYPGVTAVRAADPRRTVVIHTDRQLW